LSTWRLIALDMDGTIWKMGGGDISEETQRWIAAAQAEGIGVTFATGRNYQGLVQDTMRRLHMQMPSVTLNGSEVWHTDARLLERHTITADDIEILHRIALDYKIRCWAGTTSGMFHGDEFPTNYCDTNWLKFGYYCEDPHVISEITGNLNATQRFELTNSHPFNIEVNPHGVSKATGLQTVCDYLEIDREQVIAVGDSLNDVAMLQWAGMGVAMGNAQDAVKEAADWTTDTLDQHGVAKVIQSVLSR
jgi:hydroxymethylpyrimidine pyrophosphatase-like HAD family hydrolase